MKTVSTIVLLGFELLVGGIIGYSLRGYPSTVIPALRDGTASWSSLFGDLARQGKVRKRDTWAVLSGSKVENLGALLDDVSMDFSSVALIGRYWASKDHESLLKFITETEIDWEIRKILTRELYFIWCRTDPDAAIAATHAANARTGKGLHPPLLEELFLVNPDVALTMVQDYDTFVRPGETAFINWVKHSPAARQRLADLPADNEFRAGALRIAAIMVAKRDPVEVTKFFRESDFADVDYRNVYHEIASQWMFNDIDQAREFLRTNQDSVLRHDLEKQIGLAIARQEPLEAIDWAESRLSGSAGHEVIEGAVYELFKDNREMALGAVDTMREGRMREKVVEALISLWPGNEMPEAVRWAQTIDEGPSRQLAAP